MPMQRLIGNFNGRGGIMERGCGAGLPGKAEVKKKKSWAQGKPS